MRHLSQVAGLPTNIKFLSRLANHQAFENGEVETHFIEHFRDDLFIDPNNSELAQEAHNAATFSAFMVAACICEKEHRSLKERPPGGLSVWYAHPPFRVHHLARHTMELEWVNENDSSGSKLLTLSITYQPHGNYHIETGESSSPGLEVKVTQLGDRDFRVEANGVSMDVSLAVFSKILCLIAIEKPISLTPEHIRDEKVKVHQLVSYVFY